MWDPIPDRGMTLHAIVSFVLARVQPAGSLTEIQDFLNRALTLSP
jgi:hypothetical protein